jgi:hypothetical protein
MREDMAKVIVERPRIIDSFSPKGRVRPLDEFPKQLGMRRSQRERDGYKTLNENLAPLRRFLERQVGRPWDKVYSEIAARLRVDNTVQQHVRDHLEDFVAIKPRRGISSWYRKDDRALWHQPLYVDPRDGILKRTDRIPEARKRREARKPKKTVVERIELASLRELRRIAGIWYDVSLAFMPEYVPITANHPERPTSSPSGSFPRKNCVGTGWKTGRTTKAEPHAQNRIEGRENEPGDSRGSGRARQAVDHHPTWQADGGCGWSCGVGATIARAVLRPSADVGAA